MIQGINITSTITGKSRLLTLTEKAPHLLIIKENAVIITKTGMRGKDRVSIHARKPRFSQQKSAQIAALETYGPMVSEALDREGRGGGRTTRGARRGAKERFPST